MSGDLPKTPSPKPFERRVVVVSFVSAAFLIGAAQPSGVEDYRWKRRLLLVFAPQLSDPRLLRQKAALQTLIKGPDDRDIALFLISQNQSSPDLGSASDLRRRYGIVPDAFAVILVGKDGGVKLRSGTLVTERSLKAIVDAMPMGAEEKSLRAKAASQPVAPS